MTTATTTDEVSAARDRVDWDFRLRFGTPLDRYEISATPGFWVDKEPCAGRGGCPHPLHGCLGNGGPIRHTASYQDPPRAGGRFASPYRTWRILRAAAGEEV